MLFTKMFLKMLFTKKVIAREFTQARDLLTCINNKIKIIQV